MSRIEYNSFLNVNADNELISVKSSRNFIRYNYAIDSAGCIELRLGHGNLVEGNVLIRTKRGIVVTGDGQTVINNFIDSPQDQGILISVGSKRYTAATNSIIAHNTVINTGAPLQFALRDPEMTAPPSGNKIVNNILSGSGSAVVVTGERLPETFLGDNMISHNLMSADVGANLDLANPRLPKLVSGSSAHDGALPGYANQDIVGTPRGGANGPPDIGAFELLGP
jgi:hypothetical protein